MSFATIACSIKKMAMAEIDGMITLYSIFLFLYHKNNAIGINNRIAFNLVNTTNTESKIIHFEFGLHSITHIVSAKKNHIKTSW